MKLLVDEDISPRTSGFLEREGFDVLQVRNLDLGADDSEVVEIALQKERCIVTQDKDFGEIYYFSNPEDLKVAVVRPSKQKVEIFNRILKNQLPEIETEENGLFILKEDRVRKLK